MNISFDRNRTQKAYEAILGISVEELKANKDLFKNHILSSAEEAQLIPLLHEDALDYFYNAALSFSEGIDAVFERRYSWATVKLYYSVFYAIRASLACNNIAILANQSIMRLKVASGESPFGSGNSKYKTTHKGTISHYIDVLKSQDILLSNLIGDQNVYEWMEEVREITNYREVCFKDPDFLTIWSAFDTALSHASLVELLQDIQNDSVPIYCFQDDYAVVAIPIKRMQETVADLSKVGLLARFANERKDYLEQIVKGKERCISVW